MCTSNIKNFVSALFKLVLRKDKKIRKREINNVQVNSNRYYNIAVLKYIARTCNFTVKSAVNYIVKKPFPPYSFV